MGIVKKTAIGGALFSLLLVGAIVASVDVKPVTVSKPLFQLGDDLRAMAMVIDAHERAERERVESAEKAAQAKAEAVDAAQRAKEKNGWTVLAKAERAVESKLRDPDSAKFDQQTFSEKSGSMISCGRVNAKNGLVAYTGFTRYISTGDATFTVLDDGSADFQQAWVENCK